MRWLAPSVAANGLPSVAANPHDNAERLTGSFSTIQTTVISTIYNNCGAVVDQQHYKEAPMCRSKGFGLLRSLSLQLSMLAVLSISGVACGDAVDPNDTSPTTSPLTLADNPPFVLNDAGTQCSGLSSGKNHSIHCCPSGMAMVGAHLGANTFKCSAVSGGLAAAHLDGQNNGLVYTQRSNTHVCPVNEVMVGYYQGIPTTAGIAGSGDPELLVCARPIEQVPDLNTEYTDGGSSDGWMHVCQGWHSIPTPNSLPQGFRFAMSGIRAANNQFRCVR